MALFNKKNDVNVTVSPMNYSDDKIRYFVANLQNIGARQRQEDSFAFVNALSEEQYSQNGLMFTVCDGMGGMKDGKIASETAIQCFRNAFLNIDRISDISAQLKESMYTASDSVFSVLEGDGGSTAILCVILFEKLYFASVGDSFLYLLRDGKLLRLNSEHNMCHEIYLDNIRNGSFDIFEARNNEEAHALTSFLGMDGDILVDGTTKPIPLKKGDVILACSDGVGGVLDESELINALSDSSVHQMCTNIDAGIKSYEKPNQDNYTALVVQCL